jgi:hypothetical protein
MMPMADVAAVTNMQLTKIAASHVAVERTKHASMISSIFGCPAGADGGALTAAFKEVSGDATISSLGSMEAKRPTKSAFEATDLHCVSVDLRSAEISILLTF